MNNAITDTRRILRGLGIVTGVAALVTALLLIMSLLDFSTTGPAIRNEILRHYGGYAIYAVARLVLWTLLITIALGGLGAVLYTCTCLLGNWRVRAWGIAVAAGAGICIVTAVQLCRQLLYIPGSIAASFPYDIARLYPLWEQLTPGRLMAIQITLGGITVAIVGATLWRLSSRQQHRRVAHLAGAFGVAVGIVIWTTWFPSPNPVPIAHAASRQLNVLFVGSDTLRGDRIGLTGYPRHLTPFIDQLARQGTYFSNAYVPLARTAPSVTSLFTGTWPHTHGIRDNFNADEQAHLPVPGLPALLAKAGYDTATVGDWAGSDLSKFTLGFEHDIGPSDQWNLKYLLRQGPKDIRLFLSLYTHNRFGRVFLPELYYLAGVPLTSHVTRDAQLMLNDLATRGQPFVMNVFIASTHAPFGSEYPYYTLFSGHHYRGPSKFAVGGLTDPSSIIKAQEKDASAFDVAQIIDLYDGAVRQFDDAVARIIGHLRALGLERNTVIVIYSDHGTDLFERQTWGQGNSVVGRDPSARIPLLIIDPRRPGGNIISHVVRSVDVAPTVLALLGQPVAPSMEGVSLVPYLDNNPVDLALPAFHETGMWLGNIPGLAANHLRYPALFDMLEIPNKATGTLALRPEFALKVIAAKDRMIRTDRWKLVYLPMQDGAVYWLYDTVNDPDCRTNVIDQYPEIAAELKQKLTAWIAADPHYAWNGYHLVPKP